MKKETILFKNSYYEYALYVDEAGHLCCENDFVEILFPEGKPYGVLLALESVGEGEAKPPMMQPEFATSLSSFYKNFSFMD